MNKIATVEADSGLMIVSEPKPEKRPRNSHFEGATVNRFTQDWVTQNASIDSLLEPNLTRLRARSVSLVDNDGYAANAERQVLANVLGSEGFRLKVMAKNKRGGKDARASKEVQDAWKEFCKARNFSVTRNLSEHAFDAILLRSLFRKGGGFARMVPGYGRNPFKFALQGISIDRLDPEFSEADRRISMSVQYDTWDEVEAYHLLKQKPPSRRFTQGHHNGPKEIISAQDAIHVFIQEEFDQSQGKPWLTPVIARLRQLHGYEEAELIAARAHASKLGFFVTDFDSPAGGYKGEGNDATGNITMDGKPGSFENLPPGVKPELIDPTHPNANYPDFRKGMLRGIAAGLFTNYNLLGQDLEGVNYSSIRAGTLAERDMWKLIQRWYIDSVKKPVFEKWLEMALLTNQLSYSMEDFDRLNNAEFTGRRWDWVDPDKDSKAEERRLKARLTSHQRIARTRGEDLDEILEEIEEDQKNAGGRQLDLFLDAPTTQGLAPTSESDVERESKDTQLKFESLKAKMDAYGAGVRSGLFTPQESDEVDARAAADLPPMSDAAKSAWEEDKGYRRPITLKQRQELELLDAKVEETDAEPVEVEVTP